MVLHGRIEDLLDDGRQPVDLVDEEDVARLQVGEDGGEVAGLGQHGAAGGPEVDAQLAGDDLGEGRLAQPRRPEQQHVVEGLGPALGRLDEDPEVPLGLLLPHELVQGLRAERLVGRLERRGLGGDQPGHGVALGGATENTEDPEDGEGPASTLGIEPARRPGCARPVRLPCLSVFSGVPRLIAPAPAGRP
jgi:hypothetical protein